MGSVFWLVTESLFLDGDNLALSHRGLERGMITLGLIRIGQGKLSHRYIERIV